MAEIRQIQVDGVNYDLVISEDEVSATAAAQSAAQALAYKNQAQTSAAQAGQQATNASNQADRAEDAASRAEQIVGGEFLSYGGDQGLDFDQQDQARENIGKATFKSMNGHSVVVEHAANIPLRSLVANIVPIQYGTGDPSPSNVRSIDGWTRLRTFTAAANLYDGKYETGYYNSATAEPKDGGTYYRNTSFIAIHPLTDNYISIPVYRYYYDENHNFLYRDPSGDAVATSPAGAYYMRFFQEQSQWTTNIMVCESSEAVAYTAFTPSYEVTFPSSAGTVYGGSLNVKTGVLTVNKKMVTLTSSLTWGGANNSTSGKFYVYWNGETAETKKRDRVGANLICNKFSNTSAHTPYVTYSGSGLFQISDLNDISVTTVDAWKTWLDDNQPLQLVYGITSAETYQCTPTEVTALLGLNNIWADTGDVSLEYLEQGVLTEEYAKYAEERIPQITTKMFSNRNLLDNSWFTVRQRGGGPFNSGGYTVDRWKIAGGQPTITPIAGYGVNISQTTNTAFEQLLDPALMPFYNGKTLTLSVYTSAGIFTGTGTLNTSVSAYSIRFLLGTTGFRAGLYNNGTSYWFARIDNPSAGTYSVDIYAMKLELGSVSTLANDAPPDYETELFKCQHYFVRLRYLAYFIVGIGYAPSSTYFKIDIPVPASLRDAVLQFSYTGSPIINGNAITGGYEIYRTTTGHIQLHLVTNGLTAGNVYGLYTGPNEFIMNISADL